MTAAQALQEIGLAEIEAAAELSALDAVRVKFLGKKGLVTDALKTLGTLPAEPFQAPADMLFDLIKRKGSIRDRSDDSAC